MSWACLAARSLAGGADSDSTRERTKVRSDHAYRTLLRLGAGQTLPVVVPAMVQAARW